MPLPLIKLPFKLLPLIVLQLIEILKNLRIYGHIPPELGIVQDASALVLIIEPLSLIDEHTLVDEPLAIATPLVLPEFALVDFAVGEGEGPEAMEAVILLFPNVFGAIIVHLLDSIKG